MPPLPAARVTDMTAHGGTIVPPTAIRTIIEMIPAARLGDLHVCPLASPNPHVGGPIIKGSPTVFIEFRPAARVMDQCVCAGPPDLIAKGAMKTFIGDGGGGGGGAVGGFAPPKIPTVSVPGMPAVPVPPVRPMAAPSALCTTEGDPVDVASGRMFSMWEEFATPGGLVAFRRFYNTFTANQNGPLGWGWRHNVDERLEIGDEWVIHHDGEGRRICYPPPDVGATLRHLDENVFFTRPDAGTFVLTDDTDRQRIFRRAPNAPFARLQTVRDAGGRQQVRLDYGGGNDGPLLFLTDSVSGFRWRFDYAGGNRLMAIWRTPPDHGPEMPVARYGYDPSGCLAFAADAIGNTTHYHYDHARRMVQKTDRNGFSFYWAYDAKDRCVRSVGDNGLWDQTFTYKDADETDDEADGTTETAVRDNASRHVTRYQSSAMGVVTGITDGLNGTETREYLGLSLSRRTDALNRVTEYRADAQNRSIAVKKPSGAISQTLYGPEGLPTRIDARGETIAAALVVDDAPPRIEITHETRTVPLLTLTAAPSGGGKETELHAHDATGADTALFFDYADRFSGVRLPLGQSHRIRRDALEQITTVRDPHGVEVRFTYDALGRMVGLVRVATVGGPNGTTSPHVPPFAFGYDGEGGLIQYRDGVGAITRFERSRFNRLTARTAPSGATIRYEYHPTNELARQTDPRGADTLWHYDALGRVVQITHADGAKDAFVYDAAGQMTRYTAPDNTGFATAYDADGNRSAVRGSDGVLLRFAHDGDGRLIKAAASATETGDEKTACDYDELGLLTSETQNETTVSYRYDDACRLAEIAANNSAACQFARDANGQITQITDWNGGITRLEWADDGMLQQQTLPSGVRVLYRYSPLGLLAGETVASGRTPSAPLWTTRLVRNGNDAIVEAEDSERGTRRFVYDDDARLREAASEATGGAASPLPDETFAYDGCGNEIGQKQGYDSRNRLIVACRHDGRGNVSDYENLTFVYDSLNRLAAVTSPDGPSISYRYDALNRRTEKTVGERTTRYVWSGDTLLSETTRLGGETIDQRDYLFLPGTFVPFALRVNGHVYFCHCDWRDALTRLTDADGRIVWSASYTAWGETAAVRTDFRAGQPAFDPLLRLPGQYFDNETGLHYNRFRYYHPGLGRYLSPDPLGLAGGLNPYVYANNDPINRCDPLGRAPASSRPPSTGGATGQAAGPNGPLVSGASVPTLKAYAATGPQSTVAPPTPAPAPTPCPTPTPPPPPAGNAVCPLAGQNPYAGKAALITLDLAVGFIPIAGDLVALAGVAAGRNIITGEKLSAGDRALTAGLALAGLATLGAGDVLVGSARTLRRARMIAKLAEEERAAATLGRAAAATAKAVKEAEKAHEVVEKVEKVKEAKERLDSLNELEELAEASERRNANLRGEYPPIGKSELPPEAHNTLDAISKGGPYDFPKNDNTTFKNREGLLPAQPPGYYKEYTVKTPEELPNRGEKRIVTGDNGREMFYTDDHYKSFSRIEK